MNVPLEIHWQRLERLHRETSCMARGASKRNAHAFSNDAPRLHILTYSGQGEVARLKVVRIDDAGEEP